MIRINNKIAADEGMKLYNGEVTANEVWLAVGDDGSKWREITAEEAELLTTKITDSEALSILTGGEYGDT